MLIKNRKKMKKSEFLRGLRAVDYLANGAPSHQKTECLLLTVKIGLRF